MSSLIHVVHPVPVRIVPKGSRAERFAFAQATTPARLREVGAGEMAPVGVLTSHYPYVRTEPKHVFAHAGRLWTRLDDVVGQGVRVERLAHALTNPDPETWRLSGNDLPAAFVRSPVLALVGRGDGERGEAIDLGSVRQVVHDGTERSRADLTRFLEEDVLVAGGVVHVRCLGPIVKLAGNSIYAETGDTPLLFSPVAFPKSDGQREVEIWTESCRYDRTEEHWAFERRMKYWSARKNGLPPVRGVDGDFDGFALPDDDIHLFVNTAPAEVHRGLRIALGTELQGGPEAARAVERHLRGIQPWADLCPTAAIRPEEEEAVLARLCDAVEAMREAGFKRYVSLDGIRRFAREIALPRLRAKAELAHDDAEALSGLSL